MKYALMLECRSEYSVVLMARALGIARSGFYRWLSGRDSSRDARRLEVSQAVSSAFITHKHRYGSPRVTRELQADGINCSENWVAKLMRDNGLRAHNGKGYRYFPGPEARNNVEDNRLNRNFTADRPNQKWVADITYIRVNGVWLYLAAVLDLYSRSIVGWSIARTMQTDLIADAFSMAVARRRPEPGLLVHSDRGVQYRSGAYQHLLRQHGCVISMSRKGNCWDNAVMEAFFGRLKVELIYPQRYRQIEEARAGLFEYIEIYYNRKRRHSAIGYVSPADFERLAA